MPTVADVLALKLAALERLQTLRPMTPGDAIDQAAEELSRARNPKRRKPARSEPCIVCDAPGCETTTEAGDPVHADCEQELEENPPRGKALPVAQQEELAALAEEDFPLFSQPRELASMPALPTPWLDAVEPPARQAAVPEIASYDHVILTFSGGKDSLACVVAVQEEALRQGFDLLASGRAELWHHDIDGAATTTFMDWPCTSGYVRAVAQALRLPVFFSWRVGGFEGELLKKDAKSQDILWEEPQPDGSVIVRGSGKPSQAAIGTRLKFPQVGADLQTRWCSANLKIEVGHKALRNQERLQGKRILVVSGERAEESAARAKYETLEPDPTHAERRPTDRWRPVHHWTTAQVWDAIRRWGVVAHPAYRAGFGRVSCAFCIFAGPEEWATLAQLLPTGYERIAELEAQLGGTIARSKLSKKKAAALAERGLAFEPGATLSVRDQARIGEAFAVIGADVEEGRRLAVIHGYDGLTRVQPERWVLPLGAFRVGGGPT